MNILILTGKFGSGHNSVTTAIQQEYAANYPEAKVTCVDCLDWILPHLSPAIYALFNLSVHHFVGLYNRLNKLSNGFSKVPFSGYILRRIQAMIDQYQPDLIISVLPLGSQLISFYNRHTFIPVPFYTCITDITVHSEWLSPQCLGYFVGSQEVRHTLLAQGIPEGHIHLTGIPVKQSFHIEESPSLGGCKQLLFLGGGLGLLPKYYDNMFQVLSAIGGIHVTVITGSNKKLYRRLSKVYPGIDVLGYVSNMQDYILGSDLVITKPGGITTFECLYAGKPMFIVKPFLIQEIGNAHFAEDAGYAKVVWEDEQQALQQLLALLEDTAQLRKMNAATRPLLKAITTCSISHTVTQAINEGVAKRHANTSSQRTIIKIA